MLRRPPGFEARKRRRSGGAAEALGQLECSPRPQGRELPNLSLEGALLAKQLLRHESVATTEAYLHPSRDDLTQALA